MAGVVQPAHGDAARHVRGWGRLKIVPPRLGWSIVGLALFVGLYALFGFWIAPKLVRHYAVSYVHDTYGRTLSLGDVRVHPFKLYVELKDLALPDADGRLLLGFGRLFVDFEALSSLWERAYVFREISLDRPRVRAVVRRDGTLNLLDLVPASDETADEDGEMPSVWVKELGIERGALTLIDRARPRAFTETLAPLSFVLRNFRTSEEGGGFVLAASGENGERLAWRGHMALGAEPSGKGTITLLDVPLARVAEYLGDALPFMVTEGKLRLTTHYQVRVAKGLRAHAHWPEIALTGVALHARGDGDTAVRVPELLVTNARASLAERKLSVESVALRGLSTKARLEPDGTLNLTRLASAPSASDSPVRDNPPREANVESVWNASVGAVSLEDAKVTLEDAAFSPGATFEVAPLTVRVRDVSTDLTRSVPVTIHATVDDEATLAARGHVTPEPFAAELSVSLDDVRLARAQPYVAQHANLTIKDGSLSARGTLALAPPDSNKPALAFTGDVDVAHLRTIDNALRQHFVNMRRLALKNLRYTQGPDALAIERVDLRGAYARVALSREGMLNVASVVDAAPPEKPRAVETNASERAVIVPPKDVPKDAPSELAVDIKRVRVDDTRIDFADYFIQPNFAATLHGLHGTIQGLSSRPTSLARVALEGTLGDNARVVVRGKVQPFAYDQRTDLHLTTQNVELAVFNPYSGRFAGYNIARGELSSDIHYVLEKRALTAAHKIRIDQLKWGEKTEKNGEAPLPVKLATVLLRDRFGVIELDLPLSGSLDDPEFDVWPLVWQVVKNVIVKAVAAPFMLLAKVFEGAEDAQYISFAPGSAELDARAQRGLDALARAMVERPELRLDVPVGNVPKLDEKALREQKWRRRADLAIESALRKRERGDAQSYAELDDDKKRKVLESLYEELTGKEPRVPDAPRPQQHLSRREARAHARKFALEYLERATRALIKVERAELEALGKRRGEAIERALLAKGPIEHTRVLLSQEGKVEAKDGKVRFELGFE